MSKENIEDAKIISERLNVSLSPEQENKIKDIINNKGSGTQMKNLSVAMLRNKYTVQGALSGFALGVIIGLISGKSKILWGMSTGILGGVGGYYYGQEQAKNSQV